jgi:hypothetical protein
MNDGNDETLLLLFVEMREPVIMRNNKIVLYRTQNSQPQLSPAPPRRDELEVSA